MNCPTLCSAGVDTWRKSLLKAALEAGFKEQENLIVTDNPNSEDVVSIIKRSCCDAVLSLQCRRIFRKQLIDASPLCLNVHNAPLPLLRGCDPFAWAIADGLSQMGCTLHQIVDEGIDSGPIFGQTLWDIQPDTTAYELYCESVPRSMKLLKKILLPSLQGLIIPAPQEKRHVTYHPIGDFPFNITVVDWNRSACALSAWIRSRIFNPLQLPYFLILNEKVFILKAKQESTSNAFQDNPAQPRIKLAPGTVVSTDPLVVQTSMGTIRLMHLRISKDDFGGPELVKRYKILVGQKIETAISCM